MQEVEKVIKRSRRYWYVDGITELYMGSISILAGLFYLGFEGINALVRFLFVPTQAVPFFFYSPWAITVLVSYVMLFLVFSLLVIILQWRATQLRESFTYPRIGYLAPRTPKSAPNLILANIFIGIQLLLAYLFITPFGALLYIYQNLLFGGCLFFSLLYLYPAISSSVTRFYILSAFSTLLSIVLFQTSINPGMNMILYTTLMGVALLISGGFTFQSFARQNPLSNDELVMSNDLSNAEPDTDEKAINKEIYEVLKRSHYYWFVDGITDLHLSSLLIAIGLFHLTNNAASVVINSFRPTYQLVLENMLISLLQPCLIVILSLLLYYSLLNISQRLNKLRERFCSPRLRYLVLNTPAPKQRLNFQVFNLIFAACTLVPILIYMIMIIAFVPLKLTALVVCLSFSLVFPFLAVSLAMKRFYILTVFSIILSIVLFKINIDGDIQIQLYGTLMGIALIISGGITFRNFLRQNPLPKEELE